MNNELSWMVVKEDVKSFLGNNFPHDFHNISAPLTASIENFTEFLFAQVIIMKISNHIPSTPSV